MHKWYRPLCSSYISNNSLVKSKNDLSAEFNRETGRVSLVDMDLLTLSEHPSWHQFLWGPIFIFLCSVLLIIVGLFVFLTTRTAQTPGVKLGCSRRVGSSCSDSDTRRATHVNNPMVRNAWGKTRFGISVNRTYCATGIPNWLTKSWWRPQNLWNDDFNLTSKNPWFSSFLVSSKPLSKKSRTTSPEISGP